MDLSINVEFTAREAVKAIQRRDVIIVIDVLRCCSTIITALANGAKGVIPTKTVMEARMLHKKHPEFILAGERGGLKPRGFDLGNSPLEFSPEKVRGKHIILTTTSGTKAIIQSKNAKWVLIGALLNAGAVAKSALKIAEGEKAGISLLLSGRKGLFSLEDFLCAGTIIKSLPINEVEHSDAALSALLAFQKARASLNKVIQRGHHAQYLKSMGFKKDVEFCAQIGVFEIVPFLKEEIIIPLKGPSQD